MPTLNPIVSSQPPNFGMGDTFSFVTVENDQNRTLFAKAVYIVNPGDIAGGGGGGSTVITNTVGVSGSVTFNNASSALNASVLGLAGFVFTDNSNQVDGSFSTIQVISGTRFAGITATNSTFGNLSNYELPQGFVINGPITNYKLTYGAVLAYKL